MDLVIYENFHDYELLIRDGYKIDISFFPFRKQSLVIGENVIV